MIQKFLYFFNKNQKRSLIILFAFMLMATSLEMIGLGFVFSIIGSLGSLSTISGKDNILIETINNLFEASPSEIFLYLLIIFLFFYIIKIIFLIFYNWFEGNFLYSYRENLSSRVFKQYLTQNYNYFYNRNSSEFIRNLITEVDQFIIYLTCVLKVLLESVIVVGIFLLLAYINLIFTISISLIFLFFSFSYLFLFKEKLNIWGKQRLADTQKRIQFMQEGFDGVKIIKLLGRENFFFNKFKVHNVNLSKITTKTYFFSNLPRLLFELLGIFLITFLLFYLFLSGKNLTEIIQIITVYVAASFRILPSANRLVSSLQLIKLSYPGVNALYKELKSFKKEEENFHKNFIFNKNIVLEIQKFKYPNSNNFEISDIKLEITKGQKIGIIGPTASGKSTIIEILAGINMPTIGSVTVDGKSIFSNIRGWQNLIGFVPQKIFILDESLRSNILFGLDNKKYSDEKIISLIKKLSLGNLLNRLPNGLDGFLGEEGTNLSGGEIQRIGICRALIYNPEILVLDEATSSLDINTESQILDELKSFREKTIISIAHRINSLKYSDIIYNISKGQLLDQGNFEKFKSAERIR